MSRSKPKLDTLRALFAKSGNQCVFPGCTHPLITSKNLFVGQICHISAAESGGPRYSPALADEERRHFDNLVLLCYAHHVEVDHYPDVYTIEVLKEYKTKHEKHFQGEDFKIKESMLQEIAGEMEVYWTKIEKAQKYEHPAPNLAINIDTKATYGELIDKLHRALRRLQNGTDILRKRDEELDNEIRDMILRLEYDIKKYEKIPYYKNPFFFRNWEIHNLGILNCFTIISVLLTQIELRYLEQYLTTHGDDLEARRKFENLKKEMIDIARSVGYVD